MTLLLLVRHGATDWTAEHRLQGATDIDLSDAGRADVARLAPVIARFAPRSAVVSPLSRARSTAALLSDLTPTVDERWAEAALGDWEGRTPDELGDDYARWRAGRLVPPGGETLADLRSRVESATIRAAASCAGPVLVVTHGGTIRAALARFVGLTADRLHPVAAPSVTALDVDADGNARLTAYNLTG